MFSQDVTKQVRQQRGARQERANTLRIRESLGMNPQCFTGSSTIDNPENFVEKLKKVFDVMHVVFVERVKLDAYQLKNVSRFGTTSGRRVEVRMNHTRVGVALKKVY